MAIFAHSQECPIEHWLAGLIARHTAPNFHRRSLRIPQSDPRKVSIEAGVHHVVQRWQIAHDVARQIDNDLLAAEALNTLGVLDLKTGSLEGARMNFLRALELGGQSRELWARVEQNLGILANIQGELYEALTRYGRSLEAYRGAGDEHGCAIAYHNLGMVSADRQLYD